MADQQGVREVRKRVRLTPEQRTEQILAAATRLVARKGFYGVSLQDVADEVGITQAGLLHYVRNKEGLLELIVEQQYDRAGTPQDYIATGTPEAVHPDGPSFPGYLRYLVKFNATRPHLIQLYMVLGTEASSEAHPAHAYFADRPSSVWEQYSGVSWRLPPSIASFDDIRHLVEMSLEAMDGIQVRLFRSPAIDLVEEWLRFERVLFPSPVWDGYR